MQQQHPVETSSGLTEDHIHQLARNQQLLGIETQEDIEPELELLIKGISYLANNKIPNFITNKKKQPSYAQLYYQFVQGSPKTHNNQISQILHKQLDQIGGSFILSYQSQKIWWIRSAYVDSQFRGQGIFTRMYNRVLQNAKKCGVQQIKLYTGLDEDSKSKKLYKRLGFKVINQAFYCVYLKTPFLFSSPEIQDNQHIIINQSLTNQNEINLLILILTAAVNQLDKYHRKLYIYKQNKNQAQNKQSNQKQLVGYCSYYTEYSDWTAALAVCISVLRYKEGNIAIIPLIFQKTVNQLIKQQIQNKHENILPVSQFRLIGEHSELHQKQINKLNEQLSSLIGDQYIFQKQQNYCIMSKVLQ